eukprot:1744925-Pyramimonas_sp.AAC.1
MTYLLQPLFRLLRSRFGSDWQGGACALRPKAALPKKRPRVPEGRTASNPRRPKQAEEPATVVDSGDEWGDWSSEGL